jgi:hypothetical protein
LPKTESPNDQEATYSSIKYHIRRHSGISDGSPVASQEHFLKPGVCHSAALPLTLKSILLQKKNYENSNISPCKNIIFKKPL